MNSVVNPLGASMPQSHRANPGAAGAPGQGGQVGRDAHVAAGSAGRGNIAKEISKDIKRLTQELKAHPSNWRAYHKLRENVGFAQRNPQFHELDTLKDAQFSMAQAENSAQGAWEYEFKTRLREANDAVGQVTTPFSNLLGGPSKDALNEAFNAVDNARHLAERAPYESAQGEAKSKVDALTKKLDDKDLSRPDSAGGP